MSETPYDRARRAERHKVWRRLETLLYSDDAETSMRAFRLVLDMEEHAVDEDAGPCSIVCEGMCKVIHAFTLTCMRER